MSAPCDAGGIRSDRVIGRLVICRDNDNGVLRPTSINVRDEGVDNPNLGDGNLADGGDIESDNSLGEIIPP